MLCENNSDFESFSCGNEILVSDFCGDYKMFEGRKAKGAWGEDEGGGNSKAKEKKRKKREDHREGFFYFLHFLIFCDIIFLEGWEGGKGKRGG